MSLTDYEYLWDGSSPGWALLRAPDLKGGYCVFHKDGTLLHIESDELNEAICKKMLENGCDVLEHVPRGKTVRVTDDV